MKKQTNSSKTPSPENIFWFDAGRSYQTGMILSLSKVHRLSLQEFTTSCGLILIRYLDAKRKDLIMELYRAFTEGYEKGEMAGDEGLKTIPWAMA